MKIWKIRIKKAIVQKIVLFLKVIYGLFKLIFLNFFSLNRNDRERQLFKIVGTGMLLIKKFFENCPSRVLLFYNLPLKIQFFL